MQMRPVIPIISNQRQARVSTLILPWTDEEESQLTRLKDNNPRISWAWISLFKHSNSSFFSIAQDCSLLRSSRKGFLLCHHQRRSALHNNHCLGIGCEPRRARRTLSEICESNRHRLRHLRLRMMNLRRTRDLSVVHQEIGPTSEQGNTGSG